MKNKYIINKINYIYKWAMWAPIHNRAHLGHGFINRAQEHETGFKSPSPWERVS